MPGFDEFAQELVPMVSLTGVCVAPAKRWVVGGGEQQAVAVGVDEV